MPDTHTHTPTTADSPLLELSMHAARSIDRSNLLLAFSSNSNTHVGGPSTRPKRARTRRPPAPSAFARGCRPPAANESVDSCNHNCQQRRRRRGHARAHLAFHFRTTASIPLAYITRTTLPHTQAALTTGGGRSRRAPNCTRRPPACGGKERGCVIASRTTAGSGSSSSQGAARRTAGDPLHATPGAAAAEMEDVVEDGTIVSNAQLDCRLLEGSLVVAHIKRTCACMACLPAVVYQAVESGFGDMGGASVRPDA